MATHLAQRQLLRRIGWLVLIWAMSVLALGIVAGLFRILMAFAGLTV
jgi:Protein of unknown function (DUF2474)